MTIWGLIFFGALVTLAERLSFILLIGEREMPRRITKALQYVPVTVLTALALPTIILHENSIELSLNPKIIGAMAAIFVAWRSKNLLMTIIAGMLTFWVMAAIIPA